MTAEQTASAVWTVIESGLQIGGARAVALGLAVGRDARWPMLPWRIPGVPWLLDRVYAAVAANRYRLPGETAWCTAHPGRCNPAPD